MGGQGALCAAGLGHHMLQQAGGLPVARGLQMVRDARRDFEKAGMPASVKMADDWLSANGR